MNPCVTGLQRRRLSGQCIHAEHNQSSTANDEHQHYDNDDDNDDSPTLVQSLEKHAKLQLGEQRLPGEKRAADVADKCGQVG